MEIVGEHGHTSTGLDHVLVGLRHPAIGRPLIETVELLASEADDDGPGRVIVGWSRDVGCAPLGIQREAVVGVLCQAVETAPLAAARWWAGEVVEGEQLAFGGQRDQSIADRVNPGPCDAKGVLDRTNIVHRFGDRSCSGHRHRGWHQPIPPSSRMKTG